MKKTLELDICYDFKLERMYKMVDPMSNNIELTPWRVSLTSEILD